MNGPVTFRTRCPSRHGVFTTSTSRPGDRFHHERHIFEVLMALLYEVIGWPLTVVARPPRIRRHAQHDAERVWSAEKTLHPFGNMPVIFILLYGHVTGKQGVFDHQVR